MAATVESGQGSKSSVVVVQGDGSVITQVGTRIMRGILADSNTYTLPDAGANKFATWIIDNDTGADLIILTTSSQTINGETRQIIPNNNSMTVYSNGTNFRII